MLIGFSLLVITLGIVAAFIVCAKAIDDHEERLRILEGEYNE